MENNEVKDEAEKIRWSYSRLDTYKQCPFKYLLNYVQKHKVDTSTIATCFGTAIHHAEEDIANAIKAGQPIDYQTIRNQYLIDTLALKARFPDEWDTPDKFGVTYEEKMHAYMDDTIFGLERLMNNHPEFEIIGAEIPVDFVFESECGPRKFQGSIDRLIHDKNTNIYYVQDIKSWPRIDDHTDKELVTPIQLVVYSKYVAEKYNVSLDQIICQYDLPLSPGKRMLYNAGTAGYIKRADKKLNELFEGIHSEDWTPNPTSLCYWCAYSDTNPNAPEDGKHLCPYHMLWTRDKKSYDKEFEWAGFANHEDIMETYNIKHGLTEAISTDENVV